MAAQRVQMTSAPAHTPTDAEITYGSVVCMPK